MPYSQPFLEFDGKTPASWLCFEYNETDITLLRIPYPSDNGTSWQRCSLPEKIPLFTCDIYGAPCAFWYEDKKLYKCPITPLRTINAVLEGYETTQDTIDWKISPFRIGKIQVEFPKTWELSWNPNTQTHNTFLPEKVVIPPTLTSSRPLPVSQ